MDADSLREHGDVLLNHTMLIPVEKVDSLRQRYHEKCDNLNVKLSTSKEHDPKTNLQEVILHGMRKDVHVAERQITAWLSGKKALLVYNCLEGYILRASKDTSIDREYYGDKGIGNLIWFKAKTDVQEQKSMKSLHSPNIPLQIILQIFRYSKKTPPSNNTNKKARKPAEISADEIRFKKSVYTGFGKSTWVAL